MGFDLLPKQNRRKDITKYRSSIRLFYTRSLVTRDEKGCFLGLGFPNLLLFLSLSIYCTWLARETRSNERVPAGGWDKQEIAALSSSHCLNLLLLRLHLSCLRLLHSLLDNAYRLRRHTSSILCFGLLTCLLDLPLAQRGLGTLNLAVLVPLRAGILEHLHAHVLQLVPLSIVAVLGVQCQLLERVGRDGLSEERRGPSVGFDVVASRVSISPL